MKILSVKGLIIISLVVIIFYMISLKFNKKEEDDSYYLLRTTTGVYTLHLVLPELLLMLAYSNAYPGSREKPDYWKNILTKAGKYMDSDFWLGGNNAEEKGDCTSYGTSLSGYTALRNQILEELEKNL